MDIKSMIISKASRAGLVLKKNSPAILTGVGVVAGVAATGFAVYSTLKLDGVVTEHNIRVQRIEKNYRKAQDPDTDIVISDDDYKHQIIQQHVWLGLSVTELYLPSIAFTAVAIACTLSAHNILSKRNAALTATVSMLAEKLADYRARVVEKYGAEVDRELYHGIEEVETTDSDGKTHTEKEAQDNIPGFSRFFDEYSVYWDRDPGLNVAHVRATLTNLNQELMAKGHVFLNDAYRALGLSDTPAGSVMGWIYDKEHPDTVIDFGTNLGTNTDDPWDFVHDCPWDGKMGIKLEFNVMPEPIYNQI